MAQSSKLRAPSLDHWARAAAIRLDRFDSAGSTRNCSALARGSSVAYPAAKPVYDFALHLRPARRWYCGACAARAGRAPCARSRLGAAGGSEFGEDVAGVLLDRIQGNHQLSAISRFDMPLASNRSTPARARSAARRPRDTRQQPDRAIPWAGRSPGPPGNRHIMSNRAGRVARDGPKRSKQAIEIHPTHPTGPDDLEQRFHPRTTVHERADNTLGLAGNQGVRKDRTCRAPIASRVVRNGFQHLHFERAAGALLVLRQTPQASDHGKGALGCALGEP